MCVQVTSPADVLWWVVVEVWGPGASEFGTLGTIPYPSEEYTLTASFTGDSTYLRVRVAGGITQSWSL